MGHVANITDAQHNYVSNCGVKHNESMTLTAEYSGKFLEPETKKEFLSYINL